MHHIILSFRRITIVILLVTLSSQVAYAQDISSTPPIATNTINAVGLRELNLQTGDYTILPSITTTALVSVEYQGKRTYTIRVEEDNLSLVYHWNSKERCWELVDWDGIVMLGYLANDTEIFVPKYPTTVANKLGVYRLVAQAQAQGADGVVEPIISTNTARNGNKIFFKTTVTARPIILKSN